MDRDGNEEGVGEQDQGDMAVPAEVTASFIMIQTKAFRGLQALFDAPPCANGLDHDGQRGVWWGPDQEVGQFVGIVEAAAHEEPMTTVHGASMHDWQASPVKEAFAFGAQTL